MSFVYIAIFLYTLWQAFPAFMAWQNTPHLYGSEWIFIVWIFPLLFIAIHNRLKSTTTPLFILAIIVALLGQLGSLKALSILSFSICLAAFLPWNYWNLAWVITSISWMPAVGYIGRSLDPNFLFILRFAAATFGSSLLFYAHWRSR